MITTDARRFAPATTRNREPILEVLRRIIAPRSRILEIASGSGEHAVSLARALDVAAWQPTDPDPESRASIDAWQRHAHADAVLPAIDLDVTRTPWPTPAADPAPDAILCVNMIHISPWAACEGLFAGASQVLRPAGFLYLYGPFKRDGRHTAPSNEAFDESLRSRDPAWGVRALEDVTAAAAACGLVIEEIASMPANNLSVVLRRAMLRE